MTDWLQYNTVSAITNNISVTELQKTWALYLKWHSRKDAGGGDAYRTPISFHYTEGNTGAAPTIDVDALAAGAKEATDNGVRLSYVLANTRPFQLSGPGTGSRSIKTSI